MKDKDATHNIYLTPKEVANLLLVSPITVRQWAQKEIIKAYVTPGGHRRFLRVDVERFARKRGLALHSPSNVFRVLVVDDDRQVLNFLVDFLEELPHRIITETASDGFEAGQKLLTFQPNIILLDLMMPHLDGYQTCKIIKENPNTKSTRVVAMTAYYSQENVKRILDAGAETCLAKPIDTELLLDALGLYEEAV